jgi:hypothetical protein
VSFLRPRLLLLLSPGMVMPFLRLRLPQETYISLAASSARSLVTTSICSLPVTIQLPSCKQAEKFRHSVWDMQVPLSVMFSSCGVGIPRVPDQERGRMMGSTCLTWVSFSSMSSRALDHSHSSSITRVDTRLSSRTRPRRPIWSCRHNGWIQIHCIRWTGRRRILERCLEF